MSYFNAFYVSLKIERTTSGCQNQSNFVRSFLSDNDNDNDDNNDNDNDNDNDLFNVDNVGGGRPILRARGSCIKHLTNILQNHRN